MQLSANGNDIHYRLDGPADAPVLMFSHSLATDQGMWGAQSAFAGDYRLLRYDIRGHGASGVTPGPYSLELLAADAAALLDALGIERVHWVGISLGGMIGQAFALAYPRRLHSLVLCDTLCEFPRDAATAWRERVDTARDQGMAALVAATIERWFSPQFTADRPDLVDPIRDMVRATPVAGYIACSEAIMQLRFAQRLGEIAVPSLIVVGEDDPGTPVAASREIHERIAGSRLVIVPAARHLCNIEQPERFNTAVQTFLAAG